jgi:hypothetical protein
MRTITVLALFYFFANYGGYWANIIGPFSSSFDCNVLRSSLVARHVSVTACWGVN